MNHVKLKPTIAVIRRYSHCSPLECHFHHATPMHTAAKIRAQHPNQSSFSFKIKYLMHYLLNMKLREFDFNFFFYNLSLLYSSIVHKIIYCQCIKYKLIKYDHVVLVWNMYLRKYFTVTIRILRFYKWVDIGIFLFFKKIWYRIQWFI